MSDRRPAAFSAVEFFSKVRRGVVHSDCRAGKTLYMQGDAARALYYLEKGKVKVAVTSGQGKEAVVAILTDGNFLGEGCLAGQTVCMATATAMTDCTIVRIEKAEMIRLMHEEPELAEVFVTHLLARNIRVESDLVDQLFNSSEKRLARMLLILANFGKEGKPEEIITPISQTTLAEMIGTTRSRVSFFMNKFRQLGFIEYNGTLKVHSSLLSVVLNDQPHAEPTAHDAPELELPEK
jgi:CRP/FNR family transcriptional regulator, cyclic AMP receptor protein